MSQHMSQKQSDLVTVEEARAMLDVARATIYRMIARGELRPIPGNPAKIKQPRYFHRRDVERILHGERRVIARAS